MFIETETTPNPETLKFLPGDNFRHEGVREFLTKDEAYSSALAQKLFAIEGVKSVLFGANFISVTKADATSWDNLKPAILGIIMDHILSGESVVNDEAAAAPSFADEFFDEADQQIVDTIKELIEIRVRPAVANDGGDINFRGYRDGIVYLSMHGSCSGCPASTATLKYGIENLLQHFIPEVISVEAI